MRAVLIALLIVPWLTASARAGETAAPPSHLAAYNLDWIDYIDPADLPPSRSAVCLVDTGVRITPDTPADDPVNGPILARVAGDGGSGEPFEGSAEQLHGTRMAMAAIAPANGWGTIGAWSGGRVISVRATRDGESSFRGEAYAVGIERCFKTAAEHGASIAVINFALGCVDPCALDEAARTVLDNRVNQAHARGMSVVAAAGNIAGAGTGVPAAEPGMFAVAAGDGTGQLCDYGSFDQLVAVIGPGCPVETADPLTGDPFADPGGGSSTASVAASSALSLLRTLRPDATREQAEGWLRDSARVVDGRRVLDGATAAGAAGLSDVVARARAREPAPITAQPTVTPTPIVAPSPEPSTEPTDHPAVARRPRLPLPRPRPARWSPGRLSVGVAKLPRDAHLLLLAEGPAGELGGRPAVRRVLLDRRQTVRLRRRPVRLKLRFVLSSEFSGRRPSGWVVLERHGNRYH